MIISWVAESAVVYLARNETIFVRQRHHLLISKDV